ncbi:MAG TPA: acetyl-CoA acetyltransferase [Streptosporangiaceae bacterium]|nr:acetyl-CoA acetyltransferase [Streptosporangiaceae bacterium]
MTSLSRPVAIVGVGYSELSRRSRPDPRALTLTACRTALADAGLAPRDVDAIVQFTHASDSTEAPITAYVQRALGIDNLSFFADLARTGPSGVGPPMTAVMAVASGVCETALAYRTLPQAEGNNGGLRESPAEIGGPTQFTAVYGHAAGILANYALKKRRRMHEFGHTAQEYGYIAINARRWAALNERAVMRQPLTMDDYLSARTIVDPLVLLDCDYPVNGSCAVLVTTAERARDLRHRPVLVDAMSWGTGRGSDFVFGADLLYGGSIPCAENLWRQSRFTPADLDVLGLYDGFTHLPISWIEALGICGFGEFADWVDGGRVIGPGGTLPLNTSGGMLAEGRIQGIGHVAETTEQLRGSCGR